MKKYVLLLIVSISVLGEQACACTTFFINKNGQLIFGRNYDWYSAAGMVCTNLRGLHKTSLPVPDGNTISWVVKYGSISFNQYGKELPTGGMNEKGLVVELMWAEGSQYPAADKRAVVNVLQWIQYQLDNCSTVEEVVASDKVIRISQNNPPLHYLVADADGNAATIEFLQGKLVVHTGKALLFPVLTNNPYEQSVKVAVDAKVQAGNTSFSIRDNSLHRFATACSMVQQYNQNTIDKPVVDYAFDILDKVAQADFTKWSIVYDIRNRKIYFRTADYRDIKSLAFASFDFDCNAQAKVINMNQQLKGAIDQQFVLFNNDINRQVMELAIEESKSQVHIDDVEKETNLSYVNGISCK